MKCLSISFLLLFCVICTNSFAQDNESPEREVTVKEYRTFSLRYYNERGSLSVDLHNTYNKKKRLYTLAMRHPETFSFDIYDPLSYDDFRAEFIMKLREKEIAVDHTISEFSLHEIFMWLYTFKHEDDDLDIAKLHVKKWLKVFDANKDLVKDQDLKREQELSKAADDNSYYESKVLEKTGENDNYKKQYITTKLNENTYTDTTGEQRNKDSIALIKTSKDIMELLESVKKGKYKNGEALLKEAKVSIPKDSKEKIAYLLDSRQKAESLLDSVKLKHYRNSIFPIKMVSVQFEKGFLERVQVWVTDSTGVTDIFENFYAIGTSATINLKHYYSTRLFVRKASGDNRFIYLSDVLGTYDNLLNLYTRDYSPADTVINFIDPNKTPFLTLRKEVNIRLIDSKIFTDLNGISESSPNGLIQTELSRRFNIYTYRSQIGSRGNWGIFNSLRLYGALSKIENKAKHLPLRNSNATLNSTIVSPSYVSNLDLRRYENFSLGMSINALLLDHPDSKLTYYLDFDVRYGHVPIVDSTRRSADGVLHADSLRYLDGHTVTFSFPKITAEIFSERRIGFTLSYQYNYTLLLSNNQFKQVMSYGKSNVNDPLIEKNARKSHLFELLVRVETSREGNGQLFFRGRFFWQQGDINTFFPQLQLGYAYNIIYRK